MLKKYRLKCWSIGEQLTDHVEGIGAYLVLTQRATQEEARNLELFVSERLIHLVNENLKPYLKEVPFSSHQVKLRISFKQKRGFSYSDGSMESVALENNEITYFQELPPGLGSYPLETPVFAKESYLEAMKIVENRPIVPKKWINRTITH